MKTLISAADVRKAKAENRAYLVAPMKDFIITPEARDVAKVEGIEFVDEAPLAPQPQITQPATSAPEKAPTVAVQPAEVPANDASAMAKEIQAEIESKLANVDGEKSNLIQALVAKALADFNQQTPNSPRQINDDGIVLVRGNAVQLGVFDGAPGKNIGLTDVIGAQENSNMGVGYMGWENAFFPWTLCYDEVNVVLEGEFHVKTAAGTTIGKPGDVIFIPKGSSVEFGTPTHVRYVYITYPVEWA
ncbi:ethanolamine utilization acetate kinase EutQ [Photobacterium sp. SDRW27]|uniref:ethanolamine utilization acetate kinase EutQ n=1 Tax=Photobacterium obscurum TaxID=2829490 RepID=UPI002244B9AF|nr:ethanolamine utilization acetate kinase EutQ [Photobacterium obscurum]MCW8327760.1 ethanolamine utilization acetate kinase EutQ [Photobacterium obscurum]